MTTSEKVIIIGGGIIGLSIAFEMAVRGYQPTILEQGKCGGQATGAAAGMLAPCSEIADDPDDFFTLCLASLRKYPEWQQHVRKIANYDFEYSRSGSMHVVFHEADELELQSRVDWQTEWGIRAEIIRGNDLQKLDAGLSDTVKAAVYYPDEHHLYAPDYTQALIRACQKLGVIIHEQTGPATINALSEDRVRIGCENGMQVEAHQCVIASGAWTSFFKDVLRVPIPIFPIRGQICAYKLEQKNVEHIIFSSQGYVVPKQNGTLVCGASEDVAGFDNSVTDKGISRLIRWSKKLIPSLDGMEPYHTWAGLRPATQDGYPLLGRIKNIPNVIMASGHYRNGILLSPVTAEVVADMIEQKQPKWPLRLFQPDRFW